MATPAEIFSRTSGNLPPYLDQAYQEAAKRGMELSHREYEEFPGRRISEHPARLSRSIELSRGINTVSPYAEQALSKINRATEPPHRGYHSFLDPYQGSILRNIEREGGKVFKKKIMPALDARFIRLGQYGSSQHAEMAREAAKDLQEDILSKQEEVLTKGYQQAMQGFGLEKSRELEAAKLLNRLGIVNQAAQLADIQALREAGLLEQEREQRALDVLYEEWKARQRHPYEKLSGYLSVLQGVPYVPHTYTRSEIPRPSGTWHTGDWRNLGMNILGDVLLRARGGRVKQKPPHLCNLRG